MGKIVEKIRRVKSLMKVCEEARTLIESIISFNLFKQVEIEKFQEKEYSKNILNLNYPLLRKVKDRRNISENLKDSNGNYRYWKEIYRIRNEEYVICSQWYKNDLEYLKKWIKKISEENCIELGVNDRKNKMTKIYKYGCQSGFKYEINSLENFYLSLKTKPFVILAGISGTGKSKLVELFAEAIGAKENYNIISVKPDWTDSTELLGYKNIKGEFISGILTSIILEAIKNKDKPYFVCLDEMNLARVEYYLGEYLSLIESRYRSEDGRIVTKEIFNDGYFEKGSMYEGLYFPDNLYIIGTVNMDDTTFSFSKKVLDRTNTIEFSDADLSDLDFLDNENDEQVMPVNCDNNFMKTNFLSLKEIWNADINGIASEDLKDYAKKVNEKIIEIQEILKKYSRHFAFRVRDEIVMYMTENKILKLLEEDEAFDYQFMQKILPTISGSDEATRIILTELLKICFVEKSDEFERYSLEEIEAQVEILDVKYKLSAKKIIQMLRGYEDGYASYWI